MKKNWGVLAALTLIAGSVQASDEVGHWYVNPQFGGAWTDNSRGFDDDFYYGIGIGRHMSELLSLELNVTDGDYDGPANTELGLTTASLDLLLVFYRPRAITPFLSLGPGYIDHSFSGGGSDDDGNWMVQAGAGLLIQVFQNSRKSSALDLRPEIKLRWDFIDKADTDFYNDYLLGLGFQFSFGRAPAAP